MFGDDVHYCFIKQLPRLFSCLPSVLQLFLCGVSAWIFKNVPVRNEGRGLMNKSRYAMGVVVMSVR